MRIGMFSNAPDYWSKLRTRTLAFMRRRERPILLGEIALESHLNLRQTREMLDGMVASGVIRELTSDECKAYPNLYEGYAFVLTDPSSISRGDVE